MKAVSLTSHLSLFRISATALVCIGLLSSCGKSADVVSSAATVSGSQISPTQTTVPTVAAVCGNTVPVPQKKFTYTNSGLPLQPIGNLVNVGNFPTGGKLTPDGRFFWSVSAGHGLNDVQIVDVSNQKVKQVLPIPGTYGQVAFSPDGSTAYVSGEPQGVVKSSSNVGANGDVIHVFHVAQDGTASEQPPISLPKTYGGYGRLYGLPPNPNINSFPVGLSVSPDGHYLVVALELADQAVIFDLKNNNANRLVQVGHYPFGVAIDRQSQFAYVTNAYDGSISKIALSQSTTSNPLPTTITGLGGPFGDRNAQPQGIVQDPKRDLMYVAVTNKDGVAVIDENAGKLLKFINLQRKEGVFGAQPIDLTVSPDANTLYVADAGENAIVSIALSDRSSGQTKAYDIIGKIPTTSYPTGVGVTNDGCTLVYNTARGLGAGPNPQYGGALPARLNNDPLKGPYPSYVPDMLTGQVGVTPLPDDSGFKALQPIVDADMYPENHVAQAPANTPIHGPLIKNVNGVPSYLPSDKIKYVFLVVKENRTYDQMFGADPRGDGDPSLQLMGDNCGKNCPTVDKTRPGVGLRNGVTPNQHALSRQFVLLDHFFENSEVSVDGHIITTGAYATNYSLKSMHTDYSGRGRPGNEEGVVPVSFPPKYFIFDQLASQGISFHNYGELSGGANPLGGEPERTQFAKVLLNTNAALPVGLNSLINPSLPRPGSATYASNVYLGCISYQSVGPFQAPNTPLCAFDSGLGKTPPLALSRIDAFNANFSTQVAGCKASTLGTTACGVPQFNYMIMVSDHTNGTAVGTRDPFGMAADNDLGVGQLVDILSHSPIWPQTAIFVMEDDAQDGADHVDAHRAPAFVIGPWVKHGGQVIKTRYDQYSMFRTIELILGMNPLSTYDAMATPMYDAFAETPDNTPYSAIQPEQDIAAVVTQNSTMAAMSSLLPWDKTDVIPAEISDRLLYSYAREVKGLPVQFRAAGPNKSAYEHNRAENAMAIFKTLRNYPSLAKKALRYYLVASRKDDDD